VGNYKVLIKRSAAKELETLPAKDRGRVAARIQQLGSDPRPSGCEKLSGDDRFRIRQGNYRIIYSVEDKVLTVMVVKVGHRRDIYRRR